MNALCLSPVWMALAWTLVYSVFVVSAIGAAVLAVARSIPPSRPDARYLVLLGALVLQGAAPFAIFAVVLETPAQEASLPFLAFERAAPGRSYPIGAWLPCLWIAGTAFELGRLAVGAVGTTRLRRSARPATAPRLLRITRSVASARTLHVAVALSDRVVAPLVLGVLRPLILLPPALLNQCSTTQIQMILRHELAHVERFDNLVTLVQRVVEAILFFHPFVHWVSRRLSVERELCCDRAALADGKSPADYVRTLLDLTSASSRLSSGATVVDLRQRAYRLLERKDPPPMFTRLSLSMLIAIVLLAAFAWTSLSDASVPSAAPVVAAAVGLPPTQCPSAAHGTAPASCLDCHSTAFETALRPAGPVHAGMSESARCTDCHVAPLDGAALPRSRAEFTDCAACHTGPVATAWSVHPFVHPHLWPPSHPQTAGSDCRACHTVAPPPPPRRPEGRSRDV